MRSEDAAINSRSDRVDVLRLLTPTVEAHFNII